MKLPRQNYREKENHDRENESNDRDRVREIERTVRMSGRVFVV